VVSKRRDRKEYNKKYWKEYYSRPEVKERKKEYSARPEVMERKKEYLKEYNARPEVLEFRKEYNARPENRERKNAYMKEYNARPEVLESRKEYSKNKNASVPGRLQDAKSRSRVKNLEFNITLEYLESIYPDDSLCPLLNIPLDWNTTPKHPSTPSIDRIDNSKGYIKGNVQWVSWRANQLMRDATPDELLMVSQNYKKIYDQTILS
jgi:hypothetical protein